MMYEMCDCGHLGGNGHGVHRGQEHWLSSRKWKSYDTEYAKGHGLGIDGDRRMKQGPGPDVVTTGHGPCTKCDCPQFTWVGFCDKDGNKLTDEQVKAEVIE